MSPCFLFSTGAFPDSGPSPSAYTPALMQAGPRTSFLDVIGWAAVLAASWTWCIGMFLPVLLVRDFGPRSFVIFAVPNVLGAAIMGAALQRPGASESLVRRHGLASWGFSFVTVAF